MSSRYHSIHENDLVRAMVAQSEQAFLALAQGNGSPAPAVKILEYEEMEPFFVAGDSDAPRAGGCEGDKRERRQRQPSAGATYFRMLSITCAL
jgi:hypothetical protein